MKEENNLLSLADLSPYVRYAHVCVNAQSSTHQVPWRCIYDYELLFVTSGKLEVITEKTVFSVSENQLHMITPMMYHTVRIPENECCTYYSVHFDFVNLGQENDFSPEEIYVSACNRDLICAPVNDRLTHRPSYAPDVTAFPEKAPVSDPHAYSLLFESMIRTQREKPFAWEIDMKCSMLSLLKLMLTDRRRQMGWKPVGRRMEHFSAIVYYLLNNCGENIDFEKLAQMFGYSYSSFRKQFKQESGKSPLEYLTDLRMDRAESLLSGGQYTVAEVACMVGYEDSSYFSRVFRKHKGCTPGSLSGRGTERPDPSNR